LIKGYRIVLQVESSQPFTDYTGIITKTLVYALAPELQLTRGVKGVLSPVHISPPFTVKGDHDLGEIVMPLVEKKDNGYSIKPVEVNGEYVFHIGGESKVVDKIMKKLDSLNTPLAIKIGQAIVKYKVEKVAEITREAFEKAEAINNKVRVYLKSPAQIFNVFVPTKLPKFTPSAIEILMAPYAIMLGQYTIT
jgi:CBS domain-containing protein